MFKVPGDLILWLFFCINEIAVVLGNCSLDCTSCINDTCVTCRLGTYLEYGSCHLCPEYCTSCYNFEACSNCTEGYFGLSCAYNCPLFCINNTCNKDSGVCTGGCIDGYFLSGSSCYQCSPNCKTCATSSFNCVQCREGNYGATCEYPCSRCKDGICSKENCTYGCDDGYYPANASCNLCTIHCRSCSETFDNCHTCEDGYFGKDCQFPCNGCILCNQNDGLCSKPTTNPPMTSTDSTSPLIASKTSVSRTTTQPSTSVSHQTNTSPEPSSVPRTTTQQPTSVSPKTNTSPEPSSVPRTTTQQPTSVVPQTNTSPEPSSVSRTTTQPPTSVSHQTNTSPKPSSVSRTTTQQPTSVSPKTNTSPEPSQNLTTMESIPYQKNQSVDNTIIIYGAAGGGGGLAFLILIVVVVVICNRRGSARSHETVAENIDMTENENYISANDIDDIFRKSTDAPSEETHVVDEENDAEYSLPNKTNRPSVVPMETRST